MQFYLRFFRFWSLLWVVTSSSWLAEHAHGDELPLHREIDRLIAAQLPQRKVKSVANTATDAEFLRRISLDLTGTIPQATNIQKFVADTAPHKRSALIEQLLSSDECAEHFANVFDIMLMERRPDKYVTTFEWRDYLKKSFQANKPLDRLVHEILDSDGTDPERRAAAKFVLDREVTHDLLVRDVGRLLLGVDLQCAQCHDHPTVKDYLHEHYYGIQAFVAGTKLFKQADGTTVLQENAVREVSFASVFNPDKTKKTGPRLPHGELVEIPEFKAGDEYIEKPSSKVRAVPKFSLRQALAESLPRAETPQFARNLANRLWALMMGQGLVHPLDMHHAENPPSHPELLTLLSERLVKMNFDARQFLRELALSETYQRSSIASDSQPANEVPVESFAIGNYKPLSPEQLFASIVRATANEKTLELDLNSVTEEKKNDDDDATEKKAKSNVSPRAQELAKRMAVFSELFGGPAGSPEPDFEPTLPQALFFANSSVMSGWLAPKNENLCARLLTIDDPKQLAEELYLHVLSRTPDADEQRLVAKHLSRTQDRAKRIQELIWSLLASAEFRLNH